MTSETEPAALLHAWLLDGEGGARALEVEEIGREDVAGGVRWLHVDVGRADALELLDAVPGLDARQAALLASEDTRPNAEVAADAVRLVLRGVNLHPEADPEDMVSLRLWATAGYVTSARRRYVASVDDVLATLAEGEGPRDAGELLTALATRLVARVQNTVDALDGRVLAIEEAMEREPPSTLQHEIANARRIAIMLRRHLAPQRDALARLSAARLSWITDDERLALRDALDALVRHVEDLDSLRERATIAREELANHQSALSGRRVFLLSLVSAIFLPLSFLTGLLGINVGGIPGAESPHGFALASATLAIIALGLVLLFRFGRWL